MAFVDLFFKFFSKFIELERESLFESQHNTLVLLAGVFKGHSHLLHRFEQDLNSAITHFYQQSVKGKFKLPDNMVTFIIKRKVREALIFRITLSTD